MSFSKEAFKHTLGRFTTGVAVASTAYDGAYWGITINSLTSLSLEPALLLFCIDKKAKSYQAFTEKTPFAINILNKDQQSISQHFTQSAQTDWTDIAHHIEEGIPAIDGVCATIFCTPYHYYEGGDHTIIVGEVTRLLQSEEEPLVYYRGKYHTL